MLAFNTNYNVGDEIVEVNKVVIAVDAVRAVQGFFCSDAKRSAPPLMQ